MAIFTNLTNTVLKKIVTLKRKFLLQLAGKAWNSP